MQFQSVLVSQWYSSQSSYNQSFLPYRRAPSDIAISRFILHFICCLWLTIILSVWSKVVILFCLISLLAEGTTCRWNLLDRIECTGRNIYFRLEEIKTHREDIGRPTVSRSLFWKHKKSLYESITVLWSYQELKNSCSISWTRWTIVQCGKRTNLVSFSATTSLIFTGLATRLSWATSISRASDYLAPSTKGAFILCRTNLKTQLYFYDQAYCSH